jgi:protein ImuB
MPPRPLRLLDRPEPIEAVAEVPDGPPLLFRWRRVLRRVARARGPERIAPEWWNASGPSARPRDYYDIEDTSGRRYWVFREGQYHETGDGPPPRWYLHGLFA